MQPFAYVRVLDEERALDAGQGKSGAYLAGGTSLVDLMKLEVEKPATLIDINRIPLAHVEAQGEGARIGAMARNSDVAEHPLIKSRYPMLSEALLSGAS